MFRRSKFWYKFAAPFLVLALIVPVLAACGDDEDEGTSAPTASPTVTSETKSSITPSATFSAMPTATPTKTVSGEPVKIGVMTAWSGPSAVAGVLADQAIAVAQEYLKGVGGVLGGRAIKFEKYDSKGMVAEAVAGMTKLSRSEKVSVVAGGGASVAEFFAVVDAAEDNKVPVVIIASSPSDLSPYAYSVRGGNVQEAKRTAMQTRFILNELKPQKVAVLIDNQAEALERVEMVTKALEKTGIKIVSEQRVEIGTTDFSPYLTKMKYAKPDLCISVFAAPSSYMTVFKQIMELGGWDGVKFLDLTTAAASAAVAKMPGAQGAYSTALWAPGLPYPGSRQLEELYRKVHNMVPSPYNLPIYISIMTAIHAIELAGSDNPEDVAKALRSGNLKWEGPVGPFTIDTNGENNMTGVIVELRDGGFIPVYFE
ncbi:MAG: ABC transporter substrate-binding protein [Dehalococcoidia bacterium]